MSDRFMRLNEVLELTGLSKAAVDRMIATAGFPPPKRIGPKSLRWREAEIRTWLIQQYDPALSIEPLPPRPSGRRGFIHEGLLVSQAPAHDGRFKSATALIRNVVHVDDLAMRTSGIYFLWRGPTVVYVGQTRTGYGRIASHHAQGQKKFDGVSFIRCPVDQLDSVEREYIDRLMPEYNADSITLAAKRRRNAARRAHSTPIGDNEEGRSVP